MASSKVLIVEDSRIVAEDLQTSLEKLGFDVTGIVCAGPETLSSIKGKMPDLVLMDIVLRGEMDGIATAEQIKSQFNIPVVYLTAHSEEVVFERAKSTDPFGYLLKPFSERELDIAVQMALYKHKLEKQLKASKDTFHNIVNLNTDGIVVLDKDKIVRFLNPAACHLLGGKADDFFNIVFRCSFEPGATNDVVIQNIDGRMIDVEISATATRWQEDEAFLLTLRDVTQKKQLEHMIIMREKMASLGHVAAGMAHEIRNPLSGITLLLSALKERFKDKEKPSEILELIEEVQEAAYKIDSVIKRVGDFARPVLTTAPLLIMLIF